MKKEQKKMNNADSKTSLCSVVLPMKKEKKKMSNVDSKAARSSKKDDEVDEEVLAAAWTLVEMQQSKIDAQTAQNLQTQIQKHKKKRLVPTPRPTAKKPNRHSSQDLSKPNRHSSQDHRHDRGNNELLLLPQEPKNRDQSLALQVTASLPPVPARPIPESLFSDIMGVCSKPLYKQLCWSDLKPHLSKVTLVKKQVQKYLLPLLEERDGDAASKDGIRVVTYDWEGNSFSMQFKSWTEEKMFVLTGGWKELCSRHRDTLMVADNVAILWMFRNRLTDQICFAVNVVKMTDFKNQKELDQFIQNFVDKYHDGVRISSSPCIFRIKPLLEKK